MPPYLTETEMYIYPDNDLAENACIIDTDGERIDASVDSQLHELKTKLFERFHGDDS